MRRSRGSAGIRREEALTAVNAREGVDRSARNREEVNPMGFDALVGFLLLDTNF